MQKKQLIMKHNIRRIANSILLSCILFSLSACSDKSPETGRTPLKASECGSYKGHQLYRGPNGGCYYYDSKGEKEYIDRSHCNC